MEAGRLIEVGVEALVVARRLTGARGPRGVTLIRVAGFDMAKEGR